MTKNSKQMSANGKSKRTRGVEDASESESEDASEDESEVCKECGNYWLNGEGT